jgi:hypothetical protein
MGRVAQTPLAAVGFLTPAPRSAVPGAGASRPGGSLSAAWAVVEMIGGQWRTHVAHLPGSNEGQYSGVPVGRNGLPAPVVQSRRKLSR